MKLFREKLFEKKSFSNSFQKLLEDMFWGHKPLKHILQKSWEGVLGENTSPEGFSPKCYLLLNKYTQYMVNNI